MSTYGDDLDQLNRAVAHLLATGPRQAELKKTAKVLAARDMVWRGLQSATLAVTQLPGYEVMATGAVPPKAWPPAARFASSLTGVNTGPGDRAVLTLRHLRGGDESWRRAAVAAVGFEQHARALRQLGDDGRQTVLADVARLAMAMTHCEEDLRRRCAGVASSSRRQMGDRHLGRLRAEAGLVLEEAATAERPSQLDGTREASKRAVYVQNTRAIPVGVTRLAELWEAATEISVRDIVLSSHALQQVVAQSSRGLRRFELANADAIHASAKRVSGDLAKLAAHRRHIATLTPPSSSIELQCRFLGEVTRSVSPPPDVATATVALQALPRVTAAMADGIVIAAARGRLLTPPDQDDLRCVAGTAFWLPPASSDCSRMRAIRGDAKAARNSVERFARVARDAGSSRADPDEQPLRATRVMQGVQLLDAAQRQRQGGRASQSRLRRRA